MAEGLGLLKAELRDIPERHRSIRAVFDHSWWLLTNAERDAFMRFSVFRGGFTREAAREIVGADLSILMGLANKSMIRRDGGRYDIHELLRQYAQERLAESGQVDDARDRHCTYFADFAAERELDIKGRRQLGALDEIEADFDNIRAAWYHAAARRDFDAIDQMLESVYWFTDMRSRYREGRELFRFAENQLAPQADEMASLTWGHLLSYYQPESRENEIVRTEKAMGIAQYYGDESAIALALWAKASRSNQFTEKEKVMQLYEQSIQNFRRAGDLFGVIVAIRGLAFYAALDDFRKQMVLSKEGLNLCREIGDSRFAAFFMVYLGACHLHAYMNRQEAKGYYREADRIWRRMGNWGLAALSTLSLGLIATLEGDFEKGLDLAEESWALASEYSSREIKAFALSVLSFCKSMSESYEDALTMSMKAREIQIPNPILIYQVEWSMALAFCGLDDYEQARSCMLEALRQYGPRFQGLMTWCLPVAACIEARIGRQGRAVELLSLALSHPASSTGWMNGWPLLTRLHTELKELIKPEAFLAAWERGKVLALEDTIIDIKGGMKSIVN
jgi:tetratricopeptide (TPR) repeat protein